MSCIMATYCSGIPFFLNDHKIKFYNLSDSVIYDSLPQLHGVCHQLEKDGICMTCYYSGRIDVAPVPSFYRGIDRLKYRFRDDASPSH